jgi:hypothetical protein
MGRRPLRDDLREVFDQLSEPAHPALSARIRARLEAGQVTSPAAPRLAVAVAGALAVLLVAGLLFVSHHGLGQSQMPAGRAGPTEVTPSPLQSASPSPAPSGQPVVAPASPAPPASTPGTLPPFTCSAQTGGGAAMPAPPRGVTAVRLASQGGYDRFVIELNGPVPEYDVTPQAGATFTQGASGLPLTLAGSAGLVVTVHGAQAGGTYSGSSDLRPAGTTVVREARQAQDFEGVVSWALGLSHGACFRAFTLSGPSRLVVDVQNS